MKRLSVPLLQLLLKVSELCKYSYADYCVFRIIVNLFPVPVPTPSITVSNTDTVYAGTTLSLTCDYTLSPSVDTTPQTAVTWMVDDGAVDTSPGRISTDGATLSFSPPATSDTGNYTCTLTSKNPYIIIEDKLRTSEKFSLLVESKDIWCYFSNSYYRYTSCKTQSPSLVWMSLSATLLLCMLVLASLSHVL